MSDAYTYPSLEHTLRLVCAADAITTDERDRYLAELARLRAVEDAARSFLDEWDAGDGSDADTCEAAIALREELGVQP